MMFWNSKTSKLISAVNQGPLASVQAQCDDGVGGVSNS